LTERHHPGMAGEIISEHRARSNRNAGRHHRGFAGDFPRNPQATAPLLNSNSKCFIDVGPVELWATRWRRPSAAANPQGFCWPATPPLTHFVARVMLIRLIDCPSMKIGREQSSLGLGFAQLSCLWLALASVAVFEPIAVAVHFEDVDVVGQPVE